MIARPNRLIASIIGAWMLIGSGAIIANHRGVWLVLFAALVLFAQPFLYYGYGEDND